MKKKVMEKQLSWLAIFMTAFYSLMASCRGDECGDKELLRCARPLEKITSTSADFITTKEDLDGICPELRAGMQCVNRYATNCMEDQQRGHFLHLYEGTNEAVRELCQDGPYQDKFLKHMPCMQEVKPQFDLCSKSYTAVMQSIANGAYSNNKMESICCSFQNYLGCSRHAVLRKCGNTAAEFTKEFLDRMSSSLIKMHCIQYPQDKCATFFSSSSSSRLVNTYGFLLTAFILIAGRYLY